MTSPVRLMRRMGGRLWRTAANLRGLTIGSAHYRLPVGAASPAIREPWMRDVLTILLEVFDGDFLDVGANLGQTMLQFRSLDRRRRYVGFEPNPCCVAYLLDLISLNGLSRTDVIPAAAGREFGIGKLQFYQDSAFDSSASLVDAFRSGQRIHGERYVVIAPLDECLAAAGVGPLGLVKIDVEGFEANVIAALEHRMATDRPGLIVEILPVYDPGNLARLNDTRRIEAAAARHDYRIMRIGKTSEGQFDRFIPLAEIEVHGDMTLVDYVLCPAERVESLRPH